MKRQKLSSTYYFRTHTYVSGQAELLNYGMNEEDTMVTESCKNRDSNYSITSSFSLNYWDSASERLKTNYITTITVVKFRNCDVCLMISKIHLKYRLQEKLVKKKLLKLIRK